MILYLDTETTAIRPGQIAQLAYILDDGIRVRCKNFWFSVTELDPSSAAVNGLSVELLARYSGGRVFADDAQEICDDLTAARAVAAHNANFDLNFLRTEFRRVGLTPPEPDAFDTMTEYTPICRLTRANHAGFKYPKLSELTQFVGLGTETLCREAAALFGAQSGFHDARFDAYAVYRAAGRIDAYDPTLARKLESFKTG